MKYSIADAGRSLRTQKRSGDMLKARESDAPAYLKITKKAGARSRGISYNACREKPYKVRRLGPRASSWDSSMPGSGLTYQGIPYVSTLHSLATP